MADQTEHDRYCRRLEQMRQERSSFIDHWKEISEYTEPRRGRFLINDRNRGERRHNKIINSRATQAFRSATSGLFSGAMSPAQPNFKLETFDPDLMKNEDVKYWLFAAEEKIRQIFLESNLYNMAPPFIGEDVLFGTAAMSHLNDFENVARFYTHTAGSYFIAQNDKLEVDTFALERDWTVAQIVAAFGKENCSQYVRDAYDKGNYDTWYPVVQIIEPNTLADYASPLARDMAFTSVWFEPGNKEKKFLRRSGFEEFPVHVVRWDLTGEDIYGTSCPGMVALGDTKALQIMEKRKAQAVDKLVNPPLKGPPSLRNVPVSSLPGAVNIYDGDTSKEGLTALYQVEPRLQELRADMQSIEHRINEAFYVDLFLAISNMEGVQPKNQLELMQRNQERLLMLGPALQRLQGEFYGNLVTRTFNQGMRANIFPPLPEPLKKSALTVKFISALAMAQKAAQVSNIERVALFTTSLVSIKPDIIDKFNADGAFNKYVDGLGADPELVVPQAQVDQIRQQRAQMQAAAAQAEIQKNTAAAADSGASAAKQVAQVNSGEL
jgi:hypothetical protein